MSGVHLHQTRMTPDRNFRCAGDIRELDVATRAKLGEAKLFRAGPLVASGPVA
jgi:hypothetical protein